LPLFYDMTRIRMDEDLVGERCNINANIEQVQNAQVQANRDGISSSKIYPLCLFASSALWASPTPMHCGEKGWMITELPLVAYKC